jgi:hypothetical protein
VGREQADVREYDATAAEGRLRDALIGLRAALEEKYNFNPNQPRRPKGTPIGGQWMSELHGIQFGPDHEELGRDMVEAAATVDAFVAKHRKTITRLLGGLQAIGGGFEIVAGSALLSGGAATSEFLVGVPAVVAGAWMVQNGYDNGQAGFRALATGEPSPTNLNLLLRELGLSEPSADTVEMLLGAGGAAGGAKLGRRALDKAVEEELARRALRAFDLRLALDVRAAGRSLWTVPDIRLRGEAWEKFDVQRTGFEWRPNDPVFDQISRDGRVAISNKTLDLRRETYLRADRKALFFTLRRYIRSTATFVPRVRRIDQAPKLEERRLHLLLPFGDAVPGQALQIAAAEQYAKEWGVILKVEYAK